jgi:hypothetical protein
LGAIGIAGRIILELVLKKKKKKKCIFPEWA